MITCLITNWSVTFVLVFLLSISEWLAKTEKFKENGLLDLIGNFLRLMLHKGDQK